MMITLRPHHLLCTYAYRGNGYSPSFVQNFDQIYAALQKSDTQIILITSGDAICTACPQMTPTKACQTEAHIRELDHAVLKTFNLQLHTPYHYQALVTAMKQQMTPTKFAHCCQTCSWYDLHICQPLWCR